MTTRDLITRLRHLAALGDAAAAAEVIRWRERQCDAWCVPPYDLPRPKLSDPPAVRDAAMFAWAERHVRNHGAIFCGAWRNDARGEGVYYAALVQANGGRRTATTLLAPGGPRMFGGGDDFPPDTHCAHTDAIWMGARRGICGAWAPPSFRSPILPTLAASETTMTPPPLLLSIFAPADPAPDEAWRLDLGCGLVLCRQRDASHDDTYYVNESYGLSIAAAAASCLANERRAILDGVESGEDPRPAVARHAIRASILAALITLDPQEHTP